MSKIKSFYCNDVDKVWYDSSNVLYSECDDITDGLKVLRVTFKNGRTYQYYDVNVHDYLLFREKNPEIIQKRVRALMNGLATCGLNSMQTTNEDLRTLIDNFINGGVRTEFGTVMPA